VAVQIFILKVSPKFTDLLYLKLNVTSTTDVKRFEEAHSSPVRQFERKRIHWAVLR